MFALALLSAIAVLWVAECVERLYTDTVHTDFSVLYESGRAWLSGQSPYVLRPGGCNLSPPITLPIFIGLALLPYRVAATVLLAGSVITFGAALRIIARELHLGLSWEGAVATGIFMGTLQVLREGNLPWLLMLPATLAWRDARHDRWLRAAAWLGLCLAIKPIFGWFVFALAIRRRWMPALVSGGIAILSAFAGLAAFGVSTTRGWLEMGGAVTWFGVDTNASVLAVLRRLVPYGQFGLAYLGLAIFVLLVSGLALATSREDIDTDWSIVWMASLLVAPLGWVYYYWLAAGPLLARLRTSRSWTVALAALALCAHSPTPAIPSATGSVAYLATIGSSYSWATFVFWGEAIRRHSNSRLTATRHPGEPCGARCTKRGSTR